MAQYYVATTGNDANTGLSSGTPWLTLQYAANNTNAGDTINVAPGTYDQTSNVNTYLYSQHNGTSGSPITWISTVPGGAKVTNGNTGAGALYVWYNSGNYVTITGFDISGTGTNVAFAVNNAGTNLTMSGCLLHDVPAPNPGTQPGAGLLLATTASNCVITNCKAYNIGYAGGATNQTHGFYIQGANNTVQNCFAWNNPGWGFHVFCVTCTAQTITNNLSFNNSSGGFVNGALASNTNTNALFANNIAYNNTGYGLREAASGATVVTPTYTNNCFFGNTLGASGLIASGASVQHSILTSPAFANYQPDGSGDYHLTKSSPCIDTGTSTGAPTVDFDGRSRPQNALYDIGPYEFIPKWRGF